MLFVVEVERGCDPNRLKSAMSTNVRTTSAMVLIEVRDPAESAGLEGSTSPTRSLVFERMSLEELWLNTKQIKAPKTPNISVQTRFVTVH